MEVFGMALAGLYAVVAAASVSSASADAASPLPGGGTTAKIECSSATPPSASVTLPNTTVSVTCPGNSTVKPSTPADGGTKSKAGEDGLAEEGPPSAKDLENVYLGAECTQQGVLSSVCPGATVTPPTSDAKASPGSSVNVFFPQLPASAQVVCLKCQSTDRAVNCTALINVAAAPPQGPQACAVPGTSVTLQINQKGGSAQFACGTDLVLVPSAATKAYADDCTKEEPLKDMSRSAATGNYVTFKVDKLKKKKLCYLCKSRASETVQKAEGKDDSCKIYVEGFDKLMAARLRQDREGAWRMVGPPKQDACIFAGECQTARVPCISCWASEFLRCKS